MDFDDKVLLVIDGITFLKGVYNEENWEKSKLGHRNITGHGITTGIGLSYDGSQNQG